MYKKIYSEKGEEIGGDYTIVIGSDVLQSFGSLFNIEKYSKIAVITDKNIAESWVKRLRQGIGKEILEIVIDEGENNKNLLTLQKVWKSLVNAGFDRSSLIINFGGGVINDVGGFAASCYMRGIDFIQIPTTLLAQVDAGFGGKLAINFEGMKNYIGCFSKPVAVVVDIDTLDTVPERQFLSGFAEIIKHGLIEDEEYFREVVSKKPQTLSKDELLKIIEKSIRLKSKITCEDPREKGKRKLLNFGHTIGHGIEELGERREDRLLHGEAVAVGIVGEARISYYMEKISSKEFEHIKERIAYVGLPVNVEQFFSPEGLIDIMKKDKKNRDGETEWVLLEGIGKASFGNAVPSDVVNKAVHYICEK